MDVFIYCSRKYPLLLAITRVGATLFVPFMLLGQLGTAEVGGGPLSGRARHHRPCVARRPHQSRALAATPSAEAIFLPKGLTG